MLGPENHKVACAAVKNAIKLAPKLDSVVYDRACITLEKAKKDESLKSIKCWAVDRFHAGGHSNTCPCSPAVVHRIDRRFKGVNTSIAEQTFAWFRTYVGTFNTMNPSSQRFCVRLFASRHNDLIRTCKATHLNEYSTRKRQARAAAAWRRPASRANPCKRPAGKGVIKQLKRPSAWRVKSN